VVNISVVCVIEEKIKVFELIKNILTANKSEKNIFLYGNADFSDDIKKYMSENDALIFRFINPAFLSHEHISSEIDLAVMGEYNYHNIDMSHLGNINSILLNIDNSGKISYSNQSDKNAQIITCGLKEKDTAIFSSINLDEGTVILDLQRSIKNINGETLEPFEKQMDIPDFAAGAKTEDLILALTALAFCGRI